MTGDLRGTGRGDSKWLVVPFAATICAAMLLFAGTALADDVKPAGFQDEASRAFVTDYLDHSWRSASDPNRSALFTSRQRVGLIIPNQWNWRYRTLLHKEIAAYMGFDASGERSAVLVGKRRGAPLIGDRLLDNPAWWGMVGFDPENDSPATLGLIAFALSSVARDVPLRSGTGEFALFNNEWIDPLSRQGLEFYTYRLGRTLTTRSGRELQAVEIEAGTTKRDALVGAIWFDVETRQPVRALYRPDGRWQLRSGLVGFVKAIPGVPKRSEGSVSFLTVEYGFEDGFTRPVRAAVEGTMYWFFDQAILPVSMEWDLDWSQSAESPEGRQAIEEAGGGITPGEDGEWHVPPDVNFGDTGLTPAPLEAGWDFAISRRELRPFEWEVDRIAGRPPQQTFGRTLGSAIAGVRFNQVQGVNFKILYPLHLGPRADLNLQTTIGTSGFDPTGYVQFKQEFEPRSWNMQGYSRLKDANWMEPVNGMMSSISSILGGYDDGNYYLARGGSVGGEIHAHAISGLVEFFGERQLSVEKTETYSLFGPPDSLPPDVKADEGNFYGIRGRVNLQWGDDAQRGVAVARFFGNANFGDFSYASIGTSIDVVGPLFRPLAGGLRLTWAATQGEIPAQGKWYLGGTKTVRGYPSNSMIGNAAYVINAEIGTDLPLVRLVGFVDVGAAGSSGNLLDPEPLVSVGPGISLFDGIVRLDFAKGLTRNGIFRIHFATSGIF